MQKHDHHEITVLRQTYLLQLSVVVVIEVVEANNDCFIDAD